MTTRLPTNRRWRIGELAQAARMTVRALRHYEAIGLLAAPARTEGQQRLYGEDDVRRLYRIRALRDMGLSLSEVAAALREDGAPLGEILQAHLAKVESEIGRLERLRALLANAGEHLRAGIEPDVLPTIEAMAQVARHIEDRAKRPAPGPSGRWHAIGRSLRAHLDAGDPPSTPDVLRLALEAQARIAEFAGGNLETLVSLAHLRRNAAPAMLAGWDPELMRYLDDAMRHVQKEEREE